MGKRTRSPRRTRGVNVALHDIAVAIHDDRHLYLRVASAGGAQEVADMERALEWVAWNMSRAVPLPFGVKR